MTKFKYMEMTVTQKSFMKKSEIDKNATNHS